MKTLMMIICTISAILWSDTTLNAQLTSGKNSDTAQRRRIIEGYSAEFYAGTRLENATPANVLKWATELNKELNKNWAKFSKIKPRNAKEAKVKKAIEEAKTLSMGIIRKGTSLNAADAKKHDLVLYNTMAFVLSDCLEDNPGSECCFAGHNPGSGYAGMWFMANCFVWRFPSLD